MPWPMRRPLTAFVLSAGLAGAVAHAQTPPPATQPKSNASTQSAVPGDECCDVEPIRYETFVRTDPPLRGFVARVDLTNPLIEITAASGGPDPDGDGPWETILTPTSTIARTHDFDLAVNGTFFAHHQEDPTVRSYALNAHARSVNPIMIDGKFVTRVRTGEAITFDKNNRASIGTISKTIPPDTQTLMGGSQQLVFRGRPVAKDERPAPRTAVGLADEGKTLVILVVDGRRPEYSAGLTPKQLADEMIRLGCTSALNLDGGGSSTMVRKFGPKDFRILNQPSDGSQLAPLPLSIERPVAYVLGIRIRPQNAVPKTK